MKRLLMLHCCLLVTVLAMAGNIIVRNITELKKANSQAKPGDVIILENGEWNNVNIILNCSGTKERPITFKARTAGKVLVTGESKLKLGGNYIIVDGLYFTNGYSGKDAVIDFRVNKDQLANNCRVTNCAVNNFNNPGRMDENNWVLFSGKNNRVDHCSFVNKKNMGVLLAVLLDDDRSRENAHSIDHNYFGLRIPLASNGGEIIRVGVSQHCQFNSNTRITDNFFEHCNGETEIVSIKAGGNVVSNNLFFECQGSVVLRHGDNNTVENNIFLGNNREATGGVRVINRGQWVVNNFFYRCRGLDFRAPLAIMNGVPNSPAHRYVQVTEAVIANNTFHECSPVTFCEGSDKERSMPPDNVFFVNNLFYNDKDSIIYKVYDNISGFRFSGNQVSTKLAQNVPKGFERSMFNTQKLDLIGLPRTSANVQRPLSDSLQQAAKKRIFHALSVSPGFSNLDLAKRIYGRSSTATGVNWMRKNFNRTESSAREAKCATAGDVYRELGKKDRMVIWLTGTEYTLDKPFNIEQQVMFKSDHSKVIKISAGKMLSAFVIKGNGHLTLANLAMDGSGVKASHFISSDTSGSSQHYNLVVKDCAISGLDRNKGCEDVFHAFKSMVADSIVVRNTVFTGNNSGHIIMNEEKDDKGYYNAEKIVLEKNVFSKASGALLDIYRGGNDESTLGPQLFVRNNQFENCTAQHDEPFIQLTGVQKTRFINNTFLGCYSDKKLLVYIDIVRADHILENNTFIRSGAIQANAFVKQQ